MNTLGTLLCELADRKIVLRRSSEGGLEWEAPEGAMTAALIDAVREHETVLIGTLGAERLETSRKKLGWNRETWRLIDWLDEHAALLPRESFQLNAWSTVREPERYLETLLVRLTRGPMREADNDEMQREIGRLRTIVEERPAARSNRRAA
jgi:hypothetical protein